MAKLSQKQGVIMGFSEYSLGRPSLSFTKDESLRTQFIRIPHWWQVCKTFWRQFWRKGARQWSLWGRENSTVTIITKETLRIHEAKLREKSRNAKKDIKKEDSPDSFTSISTDIQNAIHYDLLENEIYHTCNFSRDSGSTSWYREKVSFTTESGSINELFYLRNQEHIYGQTELNSTITSHQSNDEISSNAFSQYQQSPWIGFTNMGGPMWREGQMHYPHEQFYLGKYLGYDSSFYRENSVHSVSSNKSRSSISSGSTQKSTSKKYTQKNRSDLSYLIQNAYSMSRDKKKCMKLQTRVEEEKNNNEFIDELFNRLIPVFSEIMMDPYANYFCQKLLTFASEEHITKILEQIKPKFVEIWINTHGTRAGQHLVEKMKLTKERVRLIRRALKDDIVTLAINQHGNHVLNIWLDRFPQSEINFIVDGFINNLEEVATDKHGCMVVQKCLSKCSSLQKDKLVNQIVNESLTLSQNQFGNYIMQHVINEGNYNWNQQILNIFAPHLVLLWTQKFSSNVVEKCIENFDEESRAMLIHNLERTNVMKKILVDNFGNYVIQKALKVSSKTSTAIFNKLITLVLENIRYLDQKEWGKRLIKKLWNTYPEVKRYVNKFRRKQHAQKWIKKLE